MPGPTAQPESGTAQQCRSRRTRRLLIAGAVALLAACGSTGTDPEQITAASSTTPTVATTTAAPTPPDPALEVACAAFWGDPDYTDPISRVALDRAGTVAQAGPSDPFFYAMTGDDVELVFEDAPEPARQAAAALADWFRSEPEEGADADGEAFASAWHGLAAQCAPVSAAASWAAQPDQDAPKPAPLVCAEVYDTPGTLTHFRNANVLTSNMFKLVGLSAQQVPGDRLEDVQATADLLGEQIEHVDDDGVRAALEQVQAPFLDALEGDLSSPGLREPLAQLSTACEATGYGAPDSGELEEQPARDEDDEEGLV